MSRAADGSRYVVGIDLGTTNSALAWIDLEDQAAGVSMLAVPQIQSPGAIEKRVSLPSFLYLPGLGEDKAGFAAPWGEAGPGPVGRFAQARLGPSPDQVVHSAKSWLCHRTAGAEQALLPEGGAPGHQVSALAASTAYLRHLREAWDWQMAGQNKGGRLAEQDVVLTVPASFDAAARELTLLAAREAGLPDPYLLEEPQAAVYHWAGLSGERLRANLALGDSLLVCDVGGGTTDFSLLVVGEDDGELHLERVAVGEHLLLGGDNMDLALAFHVRRQLSTEGTELDSHQFRSLVASCREGKEQLLADSAREDVALVVLARSRKLLGGSIRATLKRRDLEEVVIEGFFPEVGAEQALRDEDDAGLAALGLPFARDPSITTHLAAFLRRHRHQLGKRPGPSHLLLNGGVLAAAPLVERLERVLDQWAPDHAAPCPRRLEGANLAEGVARGAAIFAAARRGQGMRIRSGAARSYYIGMASAMPAVPGQAPQQRSICVVPFGLEEGSTVSLPAVQLGLLLGARGTFRLYASTTRNNDSAGALLDEFETEGLEELAPLNVELSGAEGQRVEVYLESRLTEIGTLEIFFVAGDGSRWQLTFGIRSGAGVIGG